MGLDNITDRELMPDEWEELRRLRLRALSLHPFYFAWTAENAAKQPEEFWRDYLSGDNKAVFGLLDRNKFIGITAVFKHRDFPDGSTADFGMTFIEPSYRGQGLSQRFYDARINWAKAHGFSRIIVAHHVDNESSKRAILRNGFLYMNEHMHDWPDGSRAPELVYELKL